MTDARRDSFATQSADEIIARQVSYHGIIGKLIDEDKALIPPCHPHR